MNTAHLIETARSIMTPGKGLLAMDESTHTCNQRFAEVGIPQTPEMRRSYRELLVTTPGLSQGISGAILFDETIRATMSGGDSFVAGLLRAGILPGIKVDLGTIDLAMFPGEKITSGLDGLAERVREYAQMGARFAKWRAVIAIGPARPTLACIDANANALAQYAAISQECGLVPIVEPEVLMDGDHDLCRCKAVTEEVLHAVFQQLRLQRVVLEAMLLKPNMVLPGSDCPEQVSVEQVACATLWCLRRAVPAAVAGIAFLSGGQPDVLATERLNATCTQHDRPHPWPLTFSFGRALQRPSLDILAGREGNTHAAQRALLHRVRCNSAAQRGTYSPSFEAEITSDTAIDRTLHDVAP